MKKIFFAITAASLIACNNSTTRSSDNINQNDSAKKFSITEKPFGVYDSKQITEYSITNPSGMQVSILNYGGTVTKLITPDKNKNMGDIVLGFESLNGYLQKGDPYFGSLVGRYANRIADAKFILDGKAYHLAGNDHGNSLHGGNKGFDKVIWEAEKIGDSSLKLVYHSKDGEEGYPGDVTATVIYTLTSDNALQIDYAATSNQPTPINLTSHCYFNLSAGADSTILNHELWINADKYTPVNDKLIPTGQIADVKGTAMDFTSAKPVGRNIDSVKGGYDHNWVLNKKGNSLEKVATLYDPTSGRVMDVWTTQPGLQFYTDNFLDGTLTDTKGGKKYIQHGALCLETQHFPDSPNQPSFPNTTLKPGETYHQTTAYKFPTVKK